jgi:hypothetical protein
MSFGAQLAGNLLASKYFGNALLKMTKPYSGFGGTPGLCYSRSIWISELNLPDQISYDTYDP